MAQVHTDSARQKEEEDLELLALFDGDRQPDPYHLLNLDAHTTRNPELEAYYEIDQNPDVEAWLASILAVDVQPNSSFDCNANTEEFKPAPVEIPSAPGPSRLVIKEARFALPNIYGCFFCARRLYSSAAYSKHARSHVRRQLRCRALVAHNTGYKICGHRARTVDELRRHTLYHHTRIKIKSQIPSF